MTADSIRRDIEVHGISDARLVFKNKSSSLTWIDGELQSPLNMYHTAFSFLFSFKIEGIVINHAQSRYFGRRCEMVEAAAHRDWGTEAFLRIAKDRAMQEGGLVK